MRIYLLAENWPPRKGGIENYLTHLTSYLPNDSVTAVVPEESEVVAGSGIKQVVGKKFFWPLVKPSWLPVYRYLKKRKDLDILLCGKALFEGLVGYYLKKHFNIPYIVFTYAMEIETWKQKKPLLRKLKKVLKNADRVVYINEVTKKSLIELGVTKKQLLKVWPGVDERFLKDVSEEEIQKTREKYGISKEYIVTVARLVGRKGIDVLIEAFSKLDQTKYGDIDLVIVGDGPEKEHLESLAENILIGNKVHFLGDVPDKYLSAIYSGSKFFALTPKETKEDIEGFGIVYIEAAGSGVPAIATRTGGAQEAVLNGETGVVVKPDSIEEVTKALSDLLSDKEKREVLGRKAKERVLSEFQWKTRVAPLAKAIKEITKSNSG